MFDQFLLFRFVIFFTKGDWFPSDMNEILLPSKLWFSSVNNFGRCSQLFTSEVSPNILLIPYIPPCTIIICHLLFYPTKYRKWSKNDFLRQNLKKKFPNAKYISYFFLINDVVSSTSRILASCFKKSQWVQPENLTILRVWLMFGELEEDLDIFKLCCSGSSKMSTCACRILQSSVTLKYPTQVRHHFRRVRVT